MSSPQLRVVLPARPENVIVVRQAVAGVGDAVGLSEERLADLKTVVTEACNNVVLHAYDQEEGPLEVTAGADAEEIEVVVKDHGTGFRPRPDDRDRTTLGLGLPLIASLSDSFEISGGAGEGTTTCVRLGFESLEGTSKNGTGPELAEETALAITPGTVVRPVLARVIGALAARADFSVDRLADTVLLGDAVSSRQGADFAEGLVSVSIRDGDGTLRVKVGPLVAGAGERILTAMDIPAGERGSLRRLASSMEVISAEDPAGGEAEFLEFEVAS
jgi:serine/threonine-protein kinase RsbW